AGPELTRAECDVCEHPVAVELDRGLVLGNRFLNPALRTQYVTFSEMGKRAARQRGKGFFDQPFGARQVSRSRVRQAIHRARRKRSRQQALCLRGLWIEF